MGLESRRSKFPPHFQKFPPHFRRTCRILRTSASLEPILSRGCIRTGAITPPASGGSNNFLARSDNGIDRSAGGHMGTPLEYQGVTARRDGHSPQSTRPRVQSQGLVVPRSRPNSTVVDGTSGVKNVFTECLVAPTCNDVVTLE